MVQGGDDGIVGKASFVDVQKFVGDGSKRIVSVATEYVDHKGDTSTHSVMASYAREYFDDSMQASLGVMSHLYKAKTDVQGAYGEMPLPKALTLACTQITLAIWIMSWGFMAVLALVKRIMTWHHHHICKQ